MNNSISKLVPIIGSLNDHAHMEEIIAYRRLHPRSQYHRRRVPGLSRAAGTSKEYARRPRVLIYRPSVFLIPYK